MLILIQEVEKERNIWMKKMKKGCRMDKEWNARVNDSPKLNNI